MRVLLLLLISLISPIIATPMSAQATTSTTNPINSQDISTLKSRHNTLQTAATTVETKRDFWHTTALIGGFIAAGFALFAGFAQHIESRRSYSLRAVSKDLAEVDGRIATLQNLELQGTIERERTARVQLLKQLGPRGLNMLQIGEVRRKLYPQFHSLPIDIVYYSGDYEMAGFASNLNILFTAWHPGMFDVFREFSRGVSIQYNPNDKVASAAAQPFFDALKPYGFRLSGPFPTLPSIPQYLLDGPRPTAGLRITVGWKDPPVIPMEELAK